MYVELNLATDASLTADPGVASSIPARSHTFVEIDCEIISTVILLPSAESFKKGCCQLQAKVCARSTGYEGCSNMNASGFITFFTYMLQQNGKYFYKGLYVTFKLAPDLKKYTVYLSSYSLLKEGDVYILTNSMLRTYTSDID